MRYCSDCRHFSGSSWKVCRHPDTREFDGSYVLAISLRKEIVAGCGRNAPLFEPRPPPPPKPRMGFWQRYLAVNRYVDVDLHLSSAGGSTFMNPHPIPVHKIIAALEREAEAQTSPQWLAAQHLRRMKDWEDRSLMCEVDTRPSVVSGDLS